MNRHFKIVPEKTEDLPPEVQKEVQKGFLALESPLGGSFLLIPDADRESGTVSEMVVVDQKGLEIGRWEPNKTVHRTEEIMGLIWDTIFSGGV